MVRGEPETLCEEIQEELYETDWQFNFSSLARSCGLVCGSGIARNTAASVRAGSRPDYGRRQRRLQSKLLRRVKRLRKNEQRVRRGGFVGRQRRCLAPYRGRWQLGGRQRW